VPSGTAGRLERPIKGLIRFCAQQQGLQATVIGRLEARGAALEPVRLIA